MRDRIIGIIFFVVFFYAICSLFGYMPDVSKKIDNTGSICWVLPGVTVIMSLYFGESPKTRPFIIKEFYAETKSFYNGETDLLR